MRCQREILIPSERVPLGGREEREKTGRRSTAVLPSTSLKCVCSAAKLEEENMPPQMRERDRTSPLHHSHTHEQKARNCLPKQQQCHCHTRHLHHLGSEQVVVVGWRKRRRDEMR